MAPLALGIDLGTSGVRVAVIDAAGELLHTQSCPYNNGLVEPGDWITGLTTLIQAIQGDLKQGIKAIAVDGTSGTLLTCDQEGVPLGEALAYNQSCTDHVAQLATLASDGGPAASPSGSLARALRLIERYGSSVLLRHQADWVNGWLLQNWSWGEEGNNLRLGWQLQEERWPEGFKHCTWLKALPQIKRSGSTLGEIAPAIAKTLGLESSVMVVAGTTDSNAAVLAANPEANDGVTVLGTTLVVKRFTDSALKGPGITSHRVAGRWLCGGASNTGGGVLVQEFPGVDLKELSRQIDPEQSSGLLYLPLPGVGERFPIDDPQLQPVLTPRPVSDALYLHGLFEGMARIEAESWKRLTTLGAKPPQRIITLGGGARNPQWRRLRERALGCRVVSSQAPPAAGVARLALAAVTI